MAPVVDRGSASLAVCVAHVLGVDPSEVLDKGDVSLRQWLAGRNLGLVPVASPEDFEWPGRFLGRRRGSSAWAVFFGVPPGVVFDPASGPDVIANEGAETGLEAAFVLAEQDPLLGLGSGPGGDGVAELIAVSGRGRRSHDGSDFC